MEFHTERDGGQEQGQPQHPLHAPEHAQAGGVDNSIIVLVIVYWHHVKQKYLHENLFNQ